MGPRGVEGELGRVLERRVAPEEVDRERPERGGDGRVDGRGGDELGPELLAPRDERRRRGDGRRRGPRRQREGVGEERALSARAGALAQPFEI